MYKRFKRSKRSEINYHCDGSTSHHLGSYFQTNILTKQRGNFYVLACPYIGDRYDEIVGCFGSSCPFDDCTNPSSNDYVTMKWIIRVNNIPNGAVVKCENGCGECKVDRKSFQLPPHIQKI